MKLLQSVETQIGDRGGWRRRLPHIAVFGAVALIYAAGGLEWLEHRFMDTRFTISERSTSGTSVHVGIDSRSIGDLQSWPWPRRYHAEMIRQLDAAGAKHIVLDIDLSSSSTPEDDAALAGAIEAAAGKVVLPMFKQHAANAQGSLVFTEPLSAFRSHAQVASINVRPETDSLVRRYNRVEAWRDTLVPSLATQLVGLMPDMLDPFYVDFGLRRESIPYFSYTDILQGRFPPVAIRGKTVFIGAVAVELSDMLAVPVHGAVPGSLFQILAFESVKMNRVIARTAQGWNLALALMAALLIGPLISASSWPRGLIVILGTGGVCFGGAAWLQYSAPISADISPILLVLVLSYIWSLIQQIDIQALRLFKQHMAAVHRRALMNSVVEESFEGIIITNADGRIEFANPAASGLLEFEPSEIVGQNILKFLSTDTVGGEIPAGTMRETGSHVLERSKTTEIESRGGLRIPVEYSTTMATLAPGASPLEKRTETRSVFIYTFRDMRAQIEAEEALRDAADKAIAADEAKSELLANVSHELRTPLNAIIGFSSMMNSEMFGPLGHKNYQEYIKDILFSGEHLLALVNNILTVSRINAGNYELSEEFVELDSVLSDCWNAISVTSEARGKTMDQDIPHDLPRVYADLKGLKQILLNLIGNAVKFTAPGGTIRVLARTEPTGEVSMVVADNGIGIAPDELPHVTEPFRQVEDAMHREHGGVGLGLHIVSKLVALHDATFEAQSELGVGTKFTVQFPRERVEGFDNVIALPGKKLSREDQA